MPGVEFYSTRQTVLSLLVSVSNEKITWEKIDVDTPTFVIESDATIVAPLIFGYLLGW